jgi:hypothetical protein
VVCLCGSNRFWRDYIEQNILETLAGRIVLSVGGFTGQDAALPGFLRVEPSPAQKAALDDLHLRKIDLADEVLILNRAVRPDKRRRGPDASPADCRSVMLLSCATRNGHDHAKRATREPPNENYVAPVVDSRCLAGAGQCFSADGVAGLGHEAGLSEDAGAASEATPERYVAPVLASPLRLALKLLSDLVTRRTKKLKPRPGGLSMSTRKLKPRVYCGPGNGQSKTGQPRFPTDSAPFRLRSIRSWRSRRPITGCWRPSWLTGCPGYVVDHIIPLKRGGRDESHRPRLNYQSTKDAGEDQPRVW